MWAWPLTVWSVQVLIHEHFRIRVAGSVYRPTQLQDVNVHLTNTTLGSDGKPAETLSKQVRQLTRRGCT
jgi:hypothetical protein